MFTLGFIEVERPHAAQVQRGCGCIIGKDYPKPIVDHADVSKANMAKMHDAYDANKEAGESDPQSRGTAGGRGGGGSSSPPRGRVAPSKKAKR